MPANEVVDLVLRLGGAALLGGLLGLQREIHGRPAGLRTHLLVSLGAATFTYLSPIMAHMSPPGPADAGRIAAQVVTGIGFLGAGAILKEGLTIRGLTTAASLWIAAAIGTTAGAGQWQASVLATILALITLAFLPALESALPSKRRHLLRIRTRRPISAARLIAVVEGTGIKVVRADQENDLRAETLDLTLTVQTFTRGLAEKHTGAVLEVLREPDLAVEKVSWRSL